MRLVLALTLALASLIIGVFLDSLTIAFTLANAALASIPWVLRRYPSAFDPFEPYFGLTILFYLYSVSTLLFVAENQISYNMEVVTSTALLKYVYVCLIGQFGLVLGFLLSPRVRQPDLDLNPSCDADNRIRILLGPALFVALVLLPFYFDRFNFSNVVSYADSALESRLLQMDDSAAGLKSVFLRDTPTLFVLCASTLILFDQKRLPLMRFGAAFVLGAYVVTSLMAGWRAQVVLGLLFPLMFFHYRVRRLPMATVLSGGGLLYLLVNALTIMRSSSDLGVMLSLLFEDVSENGLFFLKLSNSGELATSSNLLTLIMGIEDGRADFSLGGLIVSQFGAYIPRSFWPDRPLMASELFVKTFFPGVLEAGGGYGLFFHQEGYWDFGLIGVLINAATISWVTCMIYRNLMVKHFESFTVLLYTTLYGVLVLSVVRSGFVGSFKAMLMAALPLLVILWLAKKKQESVSSKDLGRDNCCS